MAQGSRQVQTQAQQQVQTLSPQQILVVKLLELPTVELEERIHSQTIVMITHNNEIAQLADRIVRIEDGKIVG